MGTIMLRHLTRKISSLTQCKLRIFWKFQSMPKQQELRTSWDKSAAQTGKQGSVRLGWRRASISEWVSQVTTRHFASPSGPHFAKGLTPRKHIVCKVLLQSFRKYHLHLYDNTIFKDVFTRVRCPTNEFAQLLNWCQRKQTKGWEMVL